MKLTGKAPSTAVPPVAPPVVSEALDSDSAQWMVARAGQTFGPYSIAQLNDFVEDGRLVVSDLVWKEGMTDWVAITEIVPELHAAQPQLPPPQTQTERSEATVGPHAHSRTKQNFERKVAVIVSAAVAGGLAGCVFGYFAAHHFPFYGGFAMLGQPFSPARWSLVPGHMLLCAILLGGLGAIVGVAVNGLEHAQNN